MLICLWYQIRFLLQSEKKDGNKHSNIAFVVLREGISSVEGLDFCLKMQRLLFKECKLAQFTFVMQLFEAVKTYTICYSIS